MNEETEPPIDVLEKAAEAAAVDAEKSEQILAAQKDPRARQLLLLDELEAFAKRMLEAGGQLGKVEGIRTEFMTLATEVQTVVSKMAEENAQLTKEASEAFTEKLSARFERHCKEQEDALASMLSHVQQKIDEFVDYYAAELQRQADHRAKEAEFLKMAASVLQRYT